MFECAGIETIKRSLKGESLSKIAGFFDRNCLREFVQNSDDRLKDKIFSVSSQAVYHEIMDAVTELDTFYNTKKPLLHRPLNFKLQENSKVSQINIFSVQYLETLSRVIYDKGIKTLFASTILLEKKTITSTQKALQLESEDFLNGAISSNSKILLKNQKIIKIKNENYETIFDVYQALLINYARGCKYVCAKKSEEEFFFEVSQTLLKSFPEPISDDEALINRVYADFLALGFLFENKMLRAYEKKYLRIKSKKENSKTEAKQTPSEFAGIHIGGLAFNMVDTWIEDNEYEDVPYTEICPEILKDQDIQKPKAPKNEKIEKQRETEKENIREPAKPKDTNGRYCKVKYILKISDTASVSAASTSGSSVESEDLIKKNKGRKNKRKNKGKNLATTTTKTTEFALDYDEWFFPEPQSIDSTNQLTTIEKE